MNVMPCTNCGRQLRLPAANGRPVMCPICRRPLVLPDSATMAPPTNQTRSFDANAETLGPGARPPAAKPPAAAAAREGVPGYEILSELGRGGMGVVSKARHLKLNRVVALKMILSGGHASEAELARFRTEAEAIARLQHPGIVQVFEVGEHDGRPYFSLEFCPGGGLDRKLNGTPLEPSAAAALLQALARAISAAHRANVVHRDLKPANVLLGDDGSPKVTDFGLAKKLDDLGQTQTGAIMGSPPYMSPEQAQGKQDVGPLADVYALGAILYECLTGRPPFKAATAVDTVMQVISQEPVALSQLNPVVPRDLETVALKCLQKDPSRRYRSADDLADDLGRFLAGEPIKARPIGPLERTVRWARKRPAIAALLLTVFGLLLVVAAVASVGYVTTGQALVRVEAAQQDAEAKRIEAEKQEKLAREAERKANEAKDQVNRQVIEQRRLRYAADVHLAGQLWDGEGGTAVRVDQLLAAATPGENEEDLREFAWRHQWGQIHAGPGILRGHGAPLLRGAWDGDGHLVTIDSAGVMHRWDVDKRESVRRTALWEGKRPDLDLAADGKTVAVLTNDRSAVRLIDVRTGKEFTLTVPDKPASLVRLTAESVLARHADGRTWVWQRETRQREGGVLTLEKLDRWSMLSPDGKTLAHRAGAANGLILLSNWKTGKDVPSPKAPGTTITAMAFSPRGERLAVGRAFGQLHAWDLKSLTELRPAQRRHPSQVSCLAFSPDGGRLAAGGKTGLAVINDLSDGKTLLLKGHLGGVGFVAFSPDGASLASGGSDGTVRLWKLAAPREPSVLYKSDPSNKLASQTVWSRDGKWLALCGEKAIRLVDGAGGAAEKSFVAPDGSLLTRVAIAPDGRTLAGATASGNVNVWDAKSGALLRSLTQGASKTAPTGQKGVLSLAYSPDGRSLAAGYGAVRGVPQPHDQIVRVWDTGSWEVRHELLHRNKVWDVAFSPDSGWLATACLDGQVRTWSVEDGKPGPALPRRSGADKGEAPVSVACAACPTTGRPLVAAGDPVGGVTVWEADTGVTRWATYEHSHRVVGLSFSADGKTLASGSRDHTVRLWHVQTGRPLRVLAYPSTQASVVNSLQFVTGDELAASDNRSGVCVWRAPSLAEMGKIQRASWRGPESEEDDADY